MIDLIQSISETVPQLDLLDQIKLPDRVISRGVQDIALRRLARIPQVYQPMLKLASMMGQEIDFALLKHLDDKFDYDEWLQMCADAAILSIQDGYWRFTHDQLRTGILALLAKDEIPLQQLAFSLPESDSGDDLSLDEVIQTIIRKT